MIYSYKSLKKRILECLLCSLILFVSCTKKELKVGETSVIPLPVQLTTSEGYFIITKKTTVSVTDDEQLKIATNFFKRFEKVAGFMPEIGVEKTTANIVFSVDTTLDEEAYELIVNKDNIYVKSASGAGFF